MLQKGLLLTVQQASSTYILLFCVNSCGSNILNYVNVQIALEYGNTIKHNFLPQSLEGSKLEVYDDYALIYHLPTGFTNILARSMRSGTIMIILCFVDMDIWSTGATAKGRYQVTVVHGQETYNLKMDIADQCLAEDAIAAKYRADRCAVSRKP